MQVSNISFSGLSNRHNKGFFPLGSKKNDKKSITHGADKNARCDRASRAVPAIPVSQTIMPEEPKKTYDASEFIDENGLLYFDAAYIAGKPYEHRITTSSDVFYISSSYDNGKKDSSHIFLEDGYDGTTVISGLEKTSQNITCDGGRTIYYTNRQESCDYVEDYDSMGNLYCSTLERYDDGKHNPADKGKFISRTTVNFDKTGTKILSTDVKIGRDYQDKVGYSSKKTYYDDNGKKNIEELTDVVKPYTFIKKRHVEFDKKSFAYSIQDSNCYFYGCENGTSPYATCNIRRIDRTNGMKTISCEGFATIDYSSGLNPLRGHIYREHPLTTRVSKGNNDIYYDEFTNEPYAVETYDENRLLSCVENLEDETVTDIEYNTERNTVNLLKKNKYGRKIEEAAFILKDNTAILNKVEEFDPITQRRITATRYKDNTIERLEFRHGNKPDRRIITEGGFTVSVADVFKGHISKDIYSTTGKTAHIEKDAEHATKTVYDENKNILYVDEFGIKYATSRTLYKDGKPEKTIQCHMGYPESDEIQGRIVLNMNEI